MTRRGLLWLSLYAIAMAYLEAAVVVSMRALYYPENPLLIFPPMIMPSTALWIELGRELATVVMILAVAALAERGAVRVFAAFVYVFGLWDLFYYVWLKLTLGWPVSWTEWDILFLIPWMWLGPWLAPALIALLFVLWGAWTLRTPQPYRFTRDALLLFVTGSTLGLTAFLQPAWPLLSGEPEAIAVFQPAGFWWPVYGIGLLLMAMGLWRIRPCPQPG